MLLKRNCLFDISIFLLLKIIIVTDCGVLITGDSSILNNENYKFSPELNYRSKRFISIGLFGDTEEYKTCIAPGNRSGHCKPVRYCILEEMRSNFLSLSQSFCNMGGMFYGMCCPDTEQEITEDNVDLSKELTIQPKIVTSGNVISENIQDIGACGVTKKYNPKIVGGRPADPKDYPWMVALMRFGLNQFCGGVLISNRHVLTAAHCIMGLKPQEIRVRLGEYDFTRKDDSDSKDFRIIKISQHPGYKDNTFMDDIAILMMNRPVNFNEFISPICLPDSEMNYVNKTATVIGWGTLGFGEAYSDVLMEVDLPIWDQANCENVLKQTVPHTSFCAGGYKERKDSCQGDSGGPLMYRLSSGRWTTIGIVSWGTACGMIGSPAIYTRVDKYQDWIDDNTAL